MSDHVSVWLDLIDHQIVDSEMRPFARIEDLELAVVPGDSALTVENLLVGAEAFGERLGGTLDRARSRAPPRRSVGWAGSDRCLVEKVDPLVQLRVPLRELPQAAPLERWLAHNLVGRVPGAGDARD